MVHVAFERAVSVNGSDISGWQDYLRHECRVGTAGSLNLLFERALAKNPRSVALWTMYLGERLRQLTIEDSIGLELIVPIDHPAINSLRMVFERGAVALDDLPFSFVALWVTFARLIGDRALSLAIFSLAVSRGVERSTMRLSNKVGDTFADCHDAAIEAAAVRLAKTQSIGSRRARPIAVITGLVDAFAFQCPARAFAYAAAHHNSLPPVPMLQALASSGARLVIKEGSALHPLGLGLLAPRVARVMNETHTWETATDAVVTWSSALLRGACFELACGVVEWAMTKPPYNRAAYHALYCCRRAMEMQWTGAAPPKPHAEREAFTVALLRRELVAKPESAMLWLRLVQASPPDRREALYREAVNATIACHDADVRCGHVFASYAKMLEAVGRPADAIQLLLRGGAEAPMAFNRDRIVLLCAAVETAIRVGAPHAPILAAAQAAAAAIGSGRWTRLAELALDLAPTVDAAASVVSVETRRGCVSLRMALCMAERAMSAKRFELAAWAIELALAGIEEARGMPFDVRAASLFSVMKLMIGTAMHAAGAALQLSTVRGAVERITAQSRVSTQQAAALWYALGILEEHRGTHDAAVAAYGQWCRLAAPGAAPLEGSATDGVFDAYLRKCVELLGGDPTVYAAPLLTGLHASVLVRRGLTLGLARWAAGAVPDARNVFHQIAAFEDPRSDTSGVWACWEALEVDASFESFEDFKRFRRTIEQSFIAAEVEAARRASIE